MDADRLELYTPLSKEECLARLADAITIEKRLFGGALSARRPVRGKMTDSSLFIRKTIDYNNSGQIHLQATITPEGSGTVITGRFLIHPTVRLIGIVWFAGLGLIGMVATVSFLFRRGPDIEGVLTPLGMLFFGFLLTRFCRYLARGEDRFLADYLIKTLDATERRSHHSATGNITG